MSQRRSHRGTRGEEFYDMHNGNQPNIWSSSSFRYPPTPRLWTIPLPPVQEVHPRMSIVTPSGTFSDPEDLLTDNVEFGMAGRELLFASQRPVVHPTMGSEPGYGVRTARDQLRGDEARLSVRFGDATRPATSPPASVTIFPEAGDVVVVKPHGGRGYLTIADVQQVVVSGNGGVRWTIEPWGADPTSGRRIFVHAHDGQDVEVEIFVRR